VLGLGQVLEGVLAHMNRDPVVAHPTSSHVAPDSESVLGADQLQAAAQFTVIRVVTHVAVGSAVCNAARMRSERGVDPRQPPALTAS
jgi:hypothetical protein